MSYFFNESYAWKKVFSVIGLPFFADSMWLNSSLAQESSPELNSFELSSRFIIFCLSLLFSSLILESWDSKDWTWERILSLEGPAGRSFSVNFWPWNLLHKGGLIKFETPSGGWKPKHIHSRSYWCCRQKNGRWPQKKWFWKGGVGSVVWGG